MSGDVIYPLVGKRIWVAGHRGMVGSALVRRLGQENCEILTAGRDRLDLTRQDQAEAWLMQEKPDAAIIAAAKVGGILANDSEPASFLYDNLMIEVNAIHGAYKAGVEKLLFLGSSCIYPRLAPQPIKEECLLEGQLEPTNQWYAIAKITGIKLCASYRRQYGADFISAMPTNLYGPGDNFDLMSSHVAPALIAKMHRAKIEGADSVEIWGSGRPKREFLHVDDLADACVHLLKAYSGELHINIGTGADLSIAELAALIRGIVGFEGELVFNRARPDGTPRKLLDVSRLSAMGWRPRIGLEQGLADTYRWYRSEVSPGSA
jgi:GDP-L-fucose synthase